MISNKKTNESIKHQANRRYDMDKEIDEMSTKNKF